jgi:hypothetical protein
MNRLGSTRQRLATWLCAGGIILALLGYRATRHVELSPTDEQILAQADELSRQLPPDIAGPMVEEVRRSVESDPAKPRPYRLAGTVALAAGIAMLGFGLVIWFRHSAASQRSRWVRANEDV